MGVSGPDGSPGQLFGGEMVGMENQAMNISEHLLGARYFSVNKTGNELYFQ